LFWERLKFRATRSGSSIADGNFSSPKLRLRHQSKPSASPAELFALVELETDRIWLFSHEQLHVRPMAVFEVVKSITLQQNIGDLKYHAKHFS
jgi:hypothetical protein